MSDVTHYALDELDTSDGGRQMEQMIDHLDRKVLARRFAEKLGRVAEALTPSQRKLLVMVVIEHKSRAEIMRALGIGDRNLRKRLTLLVRTIKKMGACGRRENFSKKFSKKVPPTPLFGVRSRGTCQTTDCHT